MSTPESSQAQQEKMRRHLADSLDLPSAGGDIPDELLDVDQDALDEQGRRLDAALTDYLSENTDHPSTAVSDAIRSMREYLRRA